jgi:hypothetical protein
VLCLVVFLLAASDDFDVGCWLVPTRHDEEMMAAINS